MFEPPEAKRYVNRKPLLSHPIQPSTPSHPQTNQSKSTNSILYSVRRDEILSRTSTSPSSSPPPESTFQDGQQRLAELLNLDSLIAAPETTTTRMTQDDTNKPAEEGKEGEEDEEQEFEFRLFSAPVSRKTADTASKPHVRDDGEVQTGKGKDDNQAGTQKLCIRLRSPTPGPADLSEGRFVNPFRGWGYYFTRPELLSGSRSQGIAGEDECADAALKRKQFEDAAVSGQHILGWALQPWPGCHLPWRVIHLKRHQTQLPKDPSVSTPAVYVTDPRIRSPKSRKKPGKKRRVQLRKRVTAAETAKEADAEKRNRKNRERKIKRRQKARETKAAAAAGGEDVDVDAAMLNVDDVSSLGED